MLTSPGRDEDADTATATAVIQERPKRKWQSYIWDSLDKTPEERKFLFKLDSALVTFACLGYFIKYLDQANINNAFVSGMKEDLGLYQNQLNYLQVAWTVGYVVSQVPSNILLTRVRPSLLIPTLELVWSILTISISRCQDVKPIYVLRFFIGFAEGGLFPGLMFILGSWYRKDELAKRACIFHTSGAVATMISGYLMAAVYRLGGRGGYAGWQWLFIIDAVISLPVALAGYFVIPDVPEICRAFYFRKEEIAFAQKRMELEGRKPRAKFTKKKIRKILTSWHIYLLALLYVTFNNGAGGAAPIFAQYLKDSKNPKYTVTQINTYPTTTYAVQIVTTLTYAWLSDSVLNGARWPPIVFGGIINIICYVSLAVWDIPNGWRWTCYIISGAGYGLSGLCMTWANEICSSDNEERAIVVGTMNEAAYVIQAWLPLIVWQQVDAPQYHKGFITISVISLILIITAFVIRDLDHKERARRRYSLSDDWHSQRSASDEDTARVPTVNTANSKAFVS